ncbi:MAG: carboxypeptidase regulatory-like domain-containing protein [Planctomycetes bacterium]|nr:carboxypeptidase regulatory-like domain-containing protein [Planctomycetota bacterium]
MRVAILGLCVLIGGGLGFWLISGGLLSGSEDDSGDDDPIGPVIIRNPGGGEQPDRPAIAVEPGPGVTPEVPNIVLVHGIVKSKDGTPLVRARLVGTPEKGRQIGTVTENDGTFELKGPPGTLTSLVVGAPRHALRDFHRVPQGARLIVILEPAVSFSGRVTDSQERPVPRARLRLFPHGRPDLGALSAETATSGRFRLDNVAPGRWDVSVEKDGLAPFHETMLVIPPPEGLKRNYVLDGGLTLRGTITTDSGALVVGGAQIEVIDRILKGRRDQNQSRRLGPYVSKPDGSFEIKALLPGTLVLLVKARGFGSIFHAHQVRTNDPAGLVATIDLPPVARLGGRVALPDGSPAPRVYVVLQPDGLQLHQFVELAPFLLGAETWSDEFGARWPAFRTKRDGTWRVDNAPAAITGKVQAVDPSGRYALSDRATFNLSKGDQAGIELRLKPGVHVSGRVTNENAEPVVGAFVEMGGTRDATDTEGGYDLRGVAEGLQNLRVSHPLALRYSERIQVPPSGIRNLDVVLDQGAVVRGAVTDTFGNPLAGATAAIRNHQDDGHGKKGRVLKSTLTKPDGTFEVGGFTADVVDVVVVAQGYESSRRDGISPNPRPLSFALRERPWELGGDVTGRVIDALTRAPIQTADIENVDRRRVVMTDGAFIIQNLRAGPVAIEFTAPGYQRHVQDGIVVRAGGATDLGPIPLYPAGSLSVTIRDKRGRVHKGPAQVTLQEAGKQANPRWARRPRRRGPTWVFPSLRPGPYFVVVRVGEQRAVRVKALVSKPSQAVTVKLAK